MGRKITINIFSKSSIENAKNEILEYKNNLINNCELFVKQLAEVGILIAEQNLGGYEKYITFYIETNPEKNGCKGLLVASNTGIIQSEWLTKDGVRMADISPLLMVEFGSGFKSQNPLDVPGVGQGTFPGQAHAFDANGWWYMDLDGVWHHSYGITPKMPMYKATVEMQTKIVEIAKEIFGHE